LSLEDNRVIKILERLETNLSKNHDRLDKLERVYEVIEDLLIYIESPSSNIEGVKNMLLEAYPMRMRNRGSR